MLLYILVFSCIFYNSTINTVKFKSFVEVYPIEENPIEVYPIEAYLIGKGVVEVFGCSQQKYTLYQKLIGDKRSYFPKIGKVNKMAYVL